MSEWTGEERRKVNYEDHDLLITIANDVKHMVGWTKNHEIQDDERFKKQSEKIDFLSKCVWLGMGGLAVFQIFLKVGVK